ncbi:MAG TPA: TolC family outer membrane protein [Burkholderiales bacterium]|nr:TolC family outer membrane protein [Burkholderiales bacterium]
MERNRTGRRAFVVCALLALTARPASGADLLDIFRQAQTADATYAAARATWAASQERIPQARAGLLPLATLSASAQYNDRGTEFRDDTTPRAATNFGSTVVTLSATQPIYRRQNSIAYDQALTQAEQADAQLALAAQDLILRVAQAYFDVLLAHDNVVLAESQKVAIGEQLELARRNYEVGVANITDTHEAQARYDLTVSQEIAARSELDLRLRALEQVIAKAPPGLAPLGARFVLKAPEPAAMDTWVGLAEQANLQVRIAQSALAFASQEIDRNRAGHLPTLDAFTTFSNSGSNRDPLGGVGTDTRAATVGVQLAIPLYQGGVVSSRVREAIATRTRSQEELEAARRAAAFNARQAYLGITNGIAQVRALEAALVSTRSQLESTQVGREVGVRTQVDVLNAQQLLFGAARDLAQAKYTYILSLLRLEAAIGELTETDLGAVNQWLDRSAALVTVRTTPMPQPIAAAPADATPAKPIAPKAAPALAPNPVPPAAREPDRAAPEVQRTIEAWAKAWASNDVAAYLSFYDASFEPPRGMTRAAWEAERTARIEKPRPIDIAIESLEVTTDGKGGAIANFRQQYRSGPLHFTTDKTLVLVRRESRWLIREERIRAETRH